MNSSSSFCDNIVWPSRSIFESPPWIIRREESGESTAILLVYFEYCHYTAMRPNLQHVPRVVLSSLSPNKAARKSSVMAQLF